LSGSYLKPPALPEVVTDTIAWEGFREGVYDVRYAATLEKAIQSASRRNEKLAQQAQFWLDLIDPKKDDLDVVRTQMVEWILKLKQYEE